MRRRCSFNFFGFWLLVFFVFISVFSGGFLFPELALAYENPGAPQGFVNDFAGMLLPAERAALEEKLRVLEGTRGVEIALVTVPSLGGDTVENFTVRLFEDWGIGKAGADNGLLILVSRDDRELRIEVGYGLEGPITDAESYWIIQNEIAPAFKAGKFYEGLNAAIERIGGVLAGEELSGTAGGGRGATGFGTNLFFLIFFVPMWIASVLARSKSWWAGGIIGAIAGVIVGFVSGFVHFGIFAVLVLTPLGLIFDYVVSRIYVRGKSSGHYPWWIGGSGFGGRGGHSNTHFGGFGGGRSGGGGASGRW